MRDAGNVSFLPRLQRSDADDLLCVQARLFIEPGNTTLMLVAPGPFVAAASCMQDRVALLNKEHLTGSVASPPQKLNLISATRSQPCQCWNHRVEPWRPCLSRRHNNARRPQPSTTFTPPFMNLPCSIYLRSGRPLRHQSDVACTSGRGINLQKSHFVEMTSTSKIISTETHGTWSVQKRIPRSTRFSAQVQQITAGDALHASLLKPMPIN